jgi:Uma2 family endonuclease
MVQPISTPHMLYEEYLEAEERSAEKHEYLRGDVFAMAGRTPEHAALAMGMGAALVAGLRGRACRVFSSDARVRVVETDFTTYPDITVVCGRLETDAQDRNAIVNPVLLVEVLSDGTEAHDRGEKTAHYRKIASLREYAFVSQHEPQVEVYRRNEAGRWELYEAGRGESVELASVGCTIAVDELYRDPLAR